MTTYRSAITGMVLLCCSAVAAAGMAGVDGAILDLQQRWAQINYTLQGEDQEKAFQALTADARKVVSGYPGRAEPLVWLAIILASDAGASGGLGALGKVKEARKLLERAEGIDDRVLSGSVYTTLGSLYYQVPGWPLSYGNKAKAELYLRKALAINPDGIDPNYFLGDLLLREDKPVLAIRYLEKAQAAPPRPGRTLADRGRRQEVAAKLQLARSRL